MSLQTSQSVYPIAVDFGAAFENDSIAQFAQWAAAQLRLEFSKTQSGEFEFVRRIPGPIEGAPEIVRAIRWRSAKNTLCASDDDATRLALWLRDELAAMGDVAHVKPIEQPSAVHDVSSALFAAYSVDDGSAHMSGCRLDDEPFLRLSYLTPGAACIEHLYFGRDGEPVDVSSVLELGLDRVEPAGPYPPRIDPQQLELLVAAGRRRAESDSTATGADGERSNAIGRPVATTIVWAKYVTGKLRFSVADAHADLVFEGWARTLAPPAFHCDASNFDTFHVAATDDGRIVAAEQIARCDKSGERVVHADLVECSATGRRVLERFTTTCPVSGKPTLREALAACSQCRQNVSKPVLIEGVCQACRELALTTADDPRIVWLLGEYPALDRFRKWRIAETADVYIVQAASLLKRLLVVVDKETIEVKRIARAARSVPRGLTWSRRSVTRCCRRWSRCDAAHAVRPPESNRPVGVSDAA